MRGKEGGCPPGLAAPDEGYPSIGVVGERGGERRKAATPGEVAALIVDAVNSIDRFCLTSFLGSEAEIRLGRDREANEVRHALNLELLHDAGAMSFDCLETDTEL